ncbi:MAG: ABC transporter ATP-binding protein [Gemmatimonadaceae bacterium]|nr:ABC transporter ATP-binding protein [Gemmatimonadaceae bacterium]
MTAPLLQIDALRVSFPGPTGRVPAVDGVTFDVRAGEVVGLVGESGCGKSVTALSILDLVGEPGRIETGSRILFEGTDLRTIDARAMRALRGRRIAMVFQEPATALNPVMTVGDQVAEVAVIHERVSWRAARARAVAMLERVGIPAAAERARQYPHELSGGMKQRVMIAMALLLSPALLIADEPTTALDVTIQAQILELLREQAAATGMSVLLITHDLGVVAELCQRVVVMYAGQVVETADVATLYTDARHPYTRGLLGAMPRLGDTRERLAVIPGTVPSPAEWPVGCRFHDRCIMGAVINLINKRLIDFEQINREATQIAEG